MKILKQKVFNLINSNKNIPGRIIFFCCTITVGVTAVAQDAEQLRLADQYFARGEYLTAAILYAQYINPPKNAVHKSDFILKPVKSGKTGTRLVSRDAVLWKQAESYRLAYYWNEALTVYKELYKRDSVNNSGALYWMAVSQRALGLLPDAAVNLDKYVNGNYTALNEEVQAEKQNLNFIKQATLRPDTVLFTIKPLQNTGMQGGLSGYIKKGNDILYTSTTTVEAETRTSNPNFSRLYIGNTSTGNDGLQVLTFDLMPQSSHQGAASLSTDGNTLYFTHWVIENGVRKSDIYKTTRNAEGWQFPQLVDGLQKEGFNNQQPFITADNKFLLFASDREGGYGGMDIWWAPILNDGKIGEVRNAGANVNSSSNEETPFYQSGSSTLVFASDKAGGMGGFDLFSTRGKMGNWVKASNLGYPVNSTRDDKYFSAAESNYLFDDAYMSSDRGNDCCLATYQISKAKKQQVITGKVLDCATGQPLANTQLGILKEDQQLLVTDSKGAYTYMLTGTVSNRWKAERDGYLEKQGLFSVQSVNENGFLTDTVIAAPICLDAKPVMIKVENVVSIYFDFDRSLIKDRAIEQLDSIYTILQENPELTLQVSGYTDGRGSEVYNKKLSDKRARSCSDNLIEKGINPERITFESFGACCPVEMELINGRDNPDGRAMNRRALIHIVK